MRFAVGVSAALGLGGVLGFITGWAVLEDKLSKKYDESLATMQGAYEYALNHPEEPEGVALDSGGEVELTQEVQQTVNGGGIQVFDPQNPAAFTPHTENPYHVAVQAPATPIEQFVGGQPNAEGISYIEDEEYLEEDGRYKSRIEILIDETNPIFFHEGTPCEDWPARVGSSILADMYDRTPPGQEAVLYVRNHRTDEDYEVVFITP